jgi:hypothetical protein
MIGMDMGRILAVFNGMKNVNMSGTPAAKEEPVEEGKRIALAPKDLLTSHKAEVSKTADEYYDKFGVPTHVEQQYDEMSDAVTTIIYYQNAEVTINTQRYDKTIGHNVFAMKNKVTECDNCNGLGKIDLGWGETVPCYECIVSGRITENEDEGPTGKYGAGLMWQKDEMDIPEEHTFKDEIAGEKFSDEDVNDHNLTIDDQLEQEGLEEDFNSDVKGFVDAWAKDSAFKQRAEQNSRQAEHEIEWCQNAIKKLEELLIRKPSKIKEITQLKHQIREKEIKLAFDPTYGAEVKELPVERQMIDKLEEVAPAGEENWVNKNKKRFKKEYGDKKGEEVLYATAWKHHNKNTDESIDVYRKLAKRKLEGKCIGCGNEPCSCKTKGKLRNRKNLGKSEWREPRVDADVETIKNQLYPKKKVGESIEESKSLAEILREQIKKLDQIEQVGE